MPAVIGVVTGVQEGCKSGTHFPASCFVWPNLDQQCALQVQYTQHAFSCIAQPPNPLEAIADAVVGASYVTTSYVTTNNMPVHLCTQVKCSTSQSFLWETASKCLAFCSTCLQLGLLLTSRACWSKLHPDVHAHRSCVAS